VTTSLSLYIYIYTHTHTQASGSSRRDYLSFSLSLSLSLYIYIYIQASGSSRRDYLRGEPWEVVDEDTDADTDFFKDASSFKDYILNDNDLKAYGSSLMSQVF
jgi:hypothetical protein